jgi:hypothetical protein
LPATSEGKKFVQVLVWDVTNIIISQYEIVLTPINRRLFADPHKRGSGSVSGQLWLRMDQVTMVQTFL